jgi:ammonia channel protein AmtB
MTGLFTQLSVNPGGADGAFYGNPVQLWYQIAGILTAIGNSLDASKLSLTIFLLRFFCYLYRRNSISFGLDHRYSIVG